MNSASPTRGNRDQALMDPLLPERLAVVRATADHHARRLVRWVRDAGQDVDDLRQALILAAWTRIAQFDPARASWSTFVNLVIRHAAWDLAAEAFRRQSRTGWSLDDAHAPLSGTSFPNEPAPDADHPDCLRAGADDVYLAVELAVDVERAIEALPDHLRRLCRLLQLEPPAVAERLSGHSTAEFYRQVNEVRMRFRSLGLRPEWTS